MTQRIIPALLSVSADQLRADVRSLSVAHELQIDLVDGDFVPFAAWPYDPPGDPAEVAEVFAGHSVELDLMVRDQLFAAEQWVAYGVQTVIFHFAGIRYKEVEQFADRHPDVSIAVALTNEIPLEELRPYVPLVHLVQLMGIATIGVQGMSFDERVLDRIRTLRDSYPDLTISIDGSMDAETIPRARAAGADRFAVGSALLRASDRSAQFAMLADIADASY